MHADQVAAHKIDSSANKEPFVPLCFGYPLRPRGWRGWHKAPLAQCSLSSPSAFAAPVSEHLTKLNIKRSKGYCFFCSFGNWDLECSQFSLTSHFAGSCLNVLLMLNLIPWSSYYTLMSVTQKIWCTISTRQGDSYLTSSHFSSASRP